MVGNGLCGHRHTQVQNGWELYMEIEIDREIETEMETEKGEEIPRNPSPSFVIDCLRCGFYRRGGM